MISSRRLNFTADDIKKAIGDQNLEEHKQIINTAEDFLKYVDKKLSNGDWELKETKEGKLAISMDCCLENHNKINEYPILLKVKEYLEKYNIRFTIVGYINIVDYKNSFNVLIDYIPIVNSHPFVKRYDDENAYIINYINNIQRDIKELETYIDYIYSVLAEKFYNKEYIIKNTMMVIHITNQTMKDKIKYTSIEYYQLNKSVPIVLKEYLKRDLKFENIMIDSIPYSTTDDKYKIKAIEINFIL